MSGLSDPEIAQDLATQRRRNRRVGFGILVGVVAVVLLAPMAFGAGLALHSACALTSLGTESIWTPGLVLNAPPNGTAVGWANGTEVGGNLQTRALGNGSAAVLEVEMNWTVYRTGMAWTVGPGFRDDCTRPYWATVAAASGGPDMTWCPLQGPGSPSDVGVSTTAPVAGCPFLGTSRAAAFNDSFQLACSNNSAYLGGCGGFSYAIGGFQHVTLGASVTGFAVEIPVPGATAGPWLAVGDPVNQTVHYSFSGPGCWIRETVGAPAGLPFGLLTWGPFGTRTMSIQGPPCSFG
jgi:hypothetical protein